MPVTDLTVNQLIRNGLRIDSASYSDNFIAFKIKQALFFLNRITNASPIYTIADFTAANSVQDTSVGTDYYFDELISLRALWAINLELYNITVTRGDGPTSTKHISDVYEQEFLRLLMSKYPYLVDVATRTGLLNFSQDTLAAGIVGQNDGREDASNAVLFDQTPRYPESTDDFQL